MFSFCTLMPVSVIGFALWHYETFIKCLVYHSTIGNVKFSKTSLEVESVQGKINVPCVKLPSYDWSVGFFVDGAFGVKDGFNIWDVVEENNTLQCSIVRNNLICEYTYPNHINGKPTVRGYIGSVFDEECYVFTVENGEPIDYQKYCDELKLHLEDL